MGKTAPPVTPNYSVSFSSISPLFHPCLRPPLRLSTDLSNINGKLIPPEIHAVCPVFLFCAAMFCLIPVSIRQHTATVSSTQHMNEI